MKGEIQKLRARYNMLKKLLEDDDYSDERQEGKPRRERRLAARLRALPVDRKCQHCRQIKLKSRQWVIRDDFVGCRSCYWSTHVKGN